MKFFVAIVYIFIMSVIGFGLMFIDKRRAIKGKRRISEASLFAVAAIGGGVGCICGMFAARHKTKRKKFIIGMPIVTFISMLIIFIIFYSL